MKPATLALLTSTLVVVAAHGEPIEDPLGSYVDPTAEDIQVAVDEYLAALNQYGSAEVWPMGWYEHLLLTKSSNASDRKTLKPIFDDEAAFYGSVRSISGRKALFTVPDLIFTEALFKPGFFADHPKCLEPSDDYNHLGPGNSAMSYYLWRRFDIDKSTYDPTAVNRGLFDPAFTLQLGDQLQAIIDATSKKEREEIEKDIVSFIKDYEYPSGQEVAKLIAQQRKASEQSRVRRENRSGLEKRRIQICGLPTVGVSSETGISADEGDGAPRWALVSAGGFLVLSIAWGFYCRQHSTTQPQNV